VILAACSAVLQLLAGDAQTGLRLAAAAGLVCIGAFLTQSRLSD
jgi:hypothetical protein